MCSSGSQPVGRDPTWGRHRFSLGSATGRQTLTKNSCTSSMLALVSVKNSALSKLIKCISYGIICRSQYHRSFKFCACCIFFCISLRGVAVLRAKIVGVARCRRFGIAALGLLHNRRLCLPGLSRAFHSISQHWNELFRRLWHLIVSQYM